MPFPLTLLILEIFLVPFLYMFPLTLLILIRISVPFLSLFPNFCPELLQRFFFSDFDET